MNLFILFSISTLIVTSQLSEGKPWSSSNSNHGWSNKKQNQLVDVPFTVEFINNKRPNSNKPFNNGCNPSGWQKPGQTQYKPLPNEQLVKPVFSAWPRPQVQQQQQWEHQLPNESLVKPVFSAWPRPSNSNANRPFSNSIPWTQKEHNRPLVDVPFTVEIIRNNRNQGNRGWSR